MVDVVVATIMRPEGDTGVQTHFRTFLVWLQGRDLPASLITPYAVPAWLLYPVFGMRRLIDCVSGVASVWWYRYWHALFLEWALRAKLADGVARVVYAQCPLSAAAALRARRNAAQKVVLVVHFNVSQADEWAGKGMIAHDGAYANSIRTFEAQALPNLDGLVFVSDFMRRELLGRIPALGRVPFTVVPNFVADPGLPDVSATPEADLVLVGSLEPRKNQVFGLDVLAAAQRMGRTLTLTIAGDGPDRAMLERRAEDLGVAAQVRFLGFVRNAAALFVQHRACLHTARIENLPLTLVEALSRGVPVFAPAVGGIGEVFDDGVEGRLIPLDEAQRAAEILIEWFDEEGRLAKAGRLARERFLRDFESDVAAERLSSFLFSVARPS
ncbi:hypothetical protein GCM10027046_13800 [Uliginosibacterium flavum]|uniref:Glycosyltransferase family 4 protein n=1 Tax=Uliginosibacterium flavum TaxID=1396831 RepID=A0ABV2TQV1_9RHOO